jgi:hypothetical protein
MKIHLFIFNSQEIKMLIQSIQQTLIILFTPDRFPNNTSDTSFIYAKLANETLEELK